MHNPFHFPTRRHFLNTLATATVACIARGNLFAAPPPLFDPRTFGAVGDGVTLDTAAIQRAIDAASQVGGGTVHLSAGQYVTGTVLLKSNVTLSLDPAATLLGSLHPADYQLVEPFTDGVGTRRGYALLACVDASNVRILGGGTGARGGTGPRGGTIARRGTIDGRGGQLVAATALAAAKSPAARPFLVLCVRSSNITLQDITLQNSAAWTTHIFQCKDVAVHNVSIHSTGLANNDGIDIDSSERVRIDGCTIVSDDDSICLKTTSSRPCTDITVTRCTLTTRCGAIKLGTESAGDFSAIRISDCHVVRANLGAIKALSVDGAHISDVVVERIQVDDCDTPIFLRLGARGRTYRAGDTARPTGTLSGVTIRDVTVQSAHRVGILISGLPRHPIEDITLERISIQMSPTDPIPELPAEPPENPATYPEVRMFGASLPASGLYARHLRNLRLTQVTLIPSPHDPRPERLLSDDHA